LRPTPHHNTLQCHTGCFGCSPTSSGTSLDQPIPVHTGISVGWKRVVGPACIVAHTLWSPPAAVIRWQEHTVMDAFFIVNVINQQLFFISMQGYTSVFSSMHLVRCADPSQSILCPLSCNWSYSCDTLACPSHKTQGASKQQPVKPGQMCLLRCFVRESGSAIPGTDMPGITKKIRQETSRLLHY